MFGFVCGLGEGEEFAVSEERGGWRCEVWGFGLICGGGGGGKGWVGRGMERGGRVRIQARFWGAVSFV